MIGRLLMILWITTLGGAMAFSAGAQEGKPKGVSAQKPDKDEVHGARTQPSSLESSTGSSPGKAGKFGPKRWDSDSRKGMEDQATPSAASSGHDSRSKKSLPLH